MRVTRRRTETHTRTDDVFEAMCRYALAHCGTTPTQRQLADMLELSQQRICYLVNRLADERRITWINRFSYMVNDSIWEPPPDSELY